MLLHGSSHSHVFSKPVQIHFRKYNPTQKVINDKIFVTNLIPHSTIPPGQIFCHTCRAWFTSSTSFSIFLSPHSHTHTHMHAQTHTYINQAERRCYGGSLVGKLPLSVYFPSARRTHGPLLTSTPPSPPFLLPKMLPTHL